MTEILQAKVMATGEIISVEEPEPLASAVLFKAVSDKIWERRTNEHLTFVDAPLEASPIEARDRLNDTLRSIDESLVIAGAGKAIDLGVPYPGEEPVVIAAEALHEPIRARVGTYNWDAQGGTWRFVEIDGERQGAEFIDGHLDYQRELYAKLRFSAPGQQGIRTVLTYAMQRYQMGQAGTTKLHINIWDSRFAETGYEGHPRGSVELTEAKELTMLETIKTLGGITLGES